MSTAPRSRHYPKWFLPAFTLFLGALVFAAYWIGGNFEDGAASFGLLAVVAAVLLFGGRSETIHLIRQPDERWAALDLVGTAITGIVLITAVIAAWLWELAHGRSGSPYGELCAISGLAYIASMAFLRFRS